MREDVQFNLRIPLTLKEKVKAATEISKRSINSEAEYRLEKSFEIESGSLEDIPLDDLLAEVMKRLNKNSLKLVLDDK